MNWDLDYFNDPVAIPWPEWGEVGYGTLKSLPSALYQTSYFLYRNFITISSSTYAK